MKSLTKTLLLIFCSLLLCIWTPIFAGVFLVVEPNDGHEPILQAIQQAQTSIKIAPYILADRKIIDALKERAAHGVSVQVMLEPQPYHPDTTAVVLHRSFYQPQKTQKMLNQAQIAVHWSHPLMLRTRNLMHEKIIIIDHKKAIIMTFNQVLSAYKNNREYGIIDTDQSDIAEIERVFDNDWEAKLLVDLTNPNLLWSPINSRIKILGLIHSAKKTLFIEIEKLSDRQVKDALTTAAKRGVKIKIITQLNCALTAKKGRITIKRPNIAEKALSMHAKMIIADSERAYIGSINLSTPSLDYNRELGILINTAHGYQEKNIVKRLNQFFLRDWDNT